MNTKGISWFRRTPLAMIILLIAAFLLAVIFRVAIGGVGVSRSSVAGLTFAAILSALCMASGLNFIFNKRVIGYGLLGTVALCVPAVIGLKAGLTYPAGNYFLWASVVTIVAVSEEAFLRGVLFDRIAAWQGNAPAVIIGAILFTILHIPLYGPPAIPLDFVVGLWFGSLRVVAKSWVTPAISHTLADLISWWL